MVDVWVCCGVALQPHGENMTDKPTEQPQPTTPPPTCRVCGRNDAMAFAPTQDGNEWICTRRHVENSVICSTRPKPLTHTDARPNHARREDDAMWREHERQEVARI